MATVAQRYASNLRPWVGEGCSVGQFPCRVDRDASVILLTPAADGVEVLQAEPDRVHSLVAGGAHRFFAMEFELLAENKMDESCMATPAIAGGLLLIRTTQHVYAIGYPVQSIVGNGQECQRRPTLLQRLRRAR